MDELDSYRFHDAYSLRDAAALICGYKPSIVWSSETGPRIAGSWEDGANDGAYQGALKGLIQAVRGGTLQANVQYQGEYCVSWVDDAEGYWQPVGDLDPTASTVSRDGLLSWLDSRGHYPSFFFPKADASQAEGSAAELEALRQQLEQEQIARESAERRTALAEDEAAELRAALEDLDEKPVDPRERVTFERLVYVLALEAKYTLEKPNADEAAIQQYASRIGAMVPTGKGSIASKLTAAVARFEQDRKDRDA